jgi:hypothetical protein
MPCMHPPPVEDEKPQAGVAAEDGTWGEWMFERGAFGEVFGDADMRYGLFVVTVAVLWGAAECAFAQTTPPAPPPRPLEIIGPEGPELLPTPPQSVQSFKSDGNNGIDSTPQPTLPPLQSGPAQSAPDVSANSEKWRYSLRNGVWWYYTPNQKWMYWSNDHWIESVPPAVSNAPQPLPPSAAIPNYQQPRVSVGVGVGVPGYGYPYAYPYGGYPNGPYGYPGYGYGPYGYGYPGVGVGFGYRRGGYGYYGRPGFGIGVY